SLLDYRCVRFLLLFFFFSSRRRHTSWPRDWSSDVCSSDLVPGNECQARGGDLYRLPESSGTPTAFLYVRISYCLHARFSTDRATPSYPESSNVRYQPRPKAGGCIPLLARFMVRSGHISNNLVQEHG